MSVSLTKDADKAICSIYREFLSRRDTGMDKKLAVEFKNPYAWPSSFSDGISLTDFKTALQELKRAGLVSTSVTGGFILSDAGIKYMEDRCPNGIAQVPDWLGKLKSAIPFL